MTAIRIRIVALLGASAAVGVLTSCGTAAKTEDHSAHGSTTAATEQVAAHNEDDVLFAQLMMPHHQQAVELAAMVPDRSTNPDVVKLAAKISAEQQPEINTMRALLLQWDVTPDGAAHESGHAGLGMQGMVNDDTMVMLQNLKGADFDTLWLKSMIDHHQGAIEMAKVEIAGGKSADMTTLARSIVSAQQVEIDQMKKMLQASGS